MNLSVHQQLKSKKADVRKQAIAKLALEGTPQAVQLLLSALADPDLEVRLMVLRALSPLRAPAVTDARITALNDSEPQVREAAVFGLMQAGDPTAIHALVPLLEDSHPSVRARAAKALDAFGWRPSEIQRPAASSSPAAVPDPGITAFERLLVALKDQKNPDRRRVVEELVQMGDSRVVKPLIAALKDPDLYLRVAVIEALGQVGDKSSVDSLLPLLRDKDPVVRAATTVALGKLNNGKIAEALGPSLKDPNSSVRKVVVATLGGLAEAGVVELLVECLTDSEHDVRETIIEALGRVGDRAAIEHLVVALVDPQPSVRNAAGRVLRNLDPAWPSSLEARRSIPTLQATLASKDYWVRHCAGDTLRRLTETSQPVDATTLFVDPSRRRRSMTLHALLNTLADWDRDLRLIAAEGLGRFGDLRAKEALKAATGDLDSWVANSAREAIGRLGESK